MELVQINSIEFEDLLDGVYNLGKRLDKTHAKLNGTYKTTHSIEMNKGAQGSLCVLRHLDKLIVKKTQNEYEKELRKELKKRGLIK